MFTKKCIKQLHSVHLNYKLICKNYWDLMCYACNDAMYHFWYMHLGFIIPGLNNYIIGLSRLTMGVNNPCAAQADCLPIHLLILVSSNAICQFRYLMLGQMQRVDLCLSKVKCFASKGSFRLMILQDCSKSEISK